MQGTQARKRKKAREQAIGKIFLYVSIGETFQVLFEPGMDGVALKSRSTIDMGRANANNQIDSSLVESPVYLQRRVPLL
jgi:hypothetical protein